MLLMSALPDVVASRIVVIQVWCGKRLRQTHVSPVPWHWLYQRRFSMGC